MGAGAAAQFKVEAKQKTNETNEND